MASSSPSAVFFGDQASEIDQVREEIRAFSSMFRSTVERARGALDRVKARKRRAVVWGAGSKGVTFLNLFKDCEALEYVVDINPHKQGMYVSGTGQRIVSPDFLRDYQPDAVFVMNPIYRKEIGRTLSDIGVSAELLLT
jgi:FlaA1/EpsC-like NDP-sugar epimerase